MKKHRKYKKIIMVFVTILFIMLVAAIGDVYKRQPPTVLIMMISPLISGSSSMATS